MSEVVEDMVVEDEGVRSSLDTQGRRKRHRQRRKRKILGVPYQPRRGSKGGPTASVRAQEIRKEMFTNGQPVAPYNTTQFLIEDHGDLHNIDAQLSKAPDGHRHSRTRDSSFSIESDDDFFYSSPEDEEEFLTKEFSLEYQDVHVERLNSLPKADIIRDYLVLESKYEKSMVELRKFKTDSGRDTDASSRSDAEVSEQLRQAQVENRRLKAELEKVKRENSKLQALRAGDDDSSVDSESDSSSSSSSEDNSNSPPESPLAAASLPESPQTAVSLPESPQAAASLPASPSDAAMPPDAFDSKGEQLVMAPDAAAAAVDGIEVDDNMGSAQERFHNSVRLDDGDDVKTEGPEISELHLKHDCEGRKDEVPQ